MKNKKAVVIGGGIGGLATAIRLRSQGLEVKLFEASPKVGGKLGEIKQDGYRWDSGPSLFTMPQFLEELFALFGKKMADYIPYQKEEKVCNYFWEDGTNLEMLSDLEKCYAELASTFDEEEVKVKDYFENSLQKYQITSPIFLQKSLHKASTYLDFKVIKALGKLGQLDLNQNLHDLNRSWFQNPKLIQLLDRFATYNGSSPYQTPGIMSMIPSLEMQFGTYFPINGMRSIAEGLYTLGKEVGVEFYLNEKVKSIKTLDRRVSGIESENNSYTSDIVVSNMDVWFTYHHLLENIPGPKKVLQAERSSSALIFYWGIKKEFPQLDLHNIFFSEEYEKEFNCLFKQKTLADDLSIYINISSKHKKEDAPAESENWFVMVNAPANEGQDWNQLREKAKANIIAKLNRMLNVSLESLIETERFMDPIIIEENTQSFRGALYGTSSNSKNSAFLRHPNFSSKVKDLYFCGGSVHPGGGIPLCLQSAKITANLIAQR